MIEAYQRLEEEIGEWASADNVVCCSSGTAALHLALESLRLPLGSKVIVPDFAMIACARAVSLAGLIPVFVDCRDDLNLDPELLDPTARVILAVHTYGRLCDMEAICRFANAHGQLVVEDCAEAHGAFLPWVTAAKCWSFYRNKIVAGEEGGAVAFLHPQHAALARQLRSLGFTDAHDFTHVPRGHNYRMSNAHAELIRRSLRDIMPNLDRRRHEEACLDAQCPAEWRLPPRDVPWVYDLRIPGLENQDRIVRKLQESGIQARHGFKPLSLQEEYRGLARRQAGLEHRAAAASREVLYLPISSPDGAFQTILRALR